MAKQRSRKLRKKTYNVATLSINARKTTAAYDLSSLGSRGLEGRHALLDYSIIVNKPKLSRKKRTYLSR